jgi:hypothetical protein
MDGYGLEAQLQGSLVAGVAHDDDPVLVHDQRLPEAELADGRGHGIDAWVVDPRVVFVRPDRVYRTFFDEHVFLPCSEKPGRKRPITKSRPAMSNRLERPH